MKPDKRRILVVDDEISSTRLLKLNLEATNDYVVRVENTPSAALAAAEAFQPDLILLDVMMPGLDGGDLACRFEASTKLSGVPIVFFTAAAKKHEVASRGGWIGGLPFLSKPASLSEVIGCIETHLGQTVRPR